MGNDRATAEPPTFGKGKGRLVATAPVVLAMGLALSLLLGGVMAHAQGVGLPDTTITSAPGETHRLGSAEFEFASSDAGASFECSLDAAQFEPCQESSTFDVSNGSHELRVRALDGTGNPDPTPARWQWWADATLQNGNFETSTRGWSVQGYTVPAWLPYGATAIAEVGGGIAGDTALKVSATSNTTPSVYASPFPVNSAVAGETYTLSGQFRSDEPGEKVCLRIRERSGSSIVTNKQSCSKTTRSWTEFVPVTLTVARDGSGLSVDFYQASAASAGESFEVDGLELTDGNAADVTPPGPAPGDPTLLATSDIASCWSSGDEAVSRMLDTMPGPIAVPGDTEQNKGSADEFAGCYDPGWGRHRARTLPAVGDHEYKTPGATGYFDYFGAAAGEYGKGWYSYDLGSWHIVVLNSNCANVGGCSTGSEQYEWLKDDLEENGGDCIGAYWHHPLFSSGTLHGGLTRSRPFWNLLYEYGAEWTLNGNDHAYQRLARQTPTGALDTAAGMREFIVATGGTRLDALGAPLPNTEVQNNTAFGVLQLGLHEDSYDWEFVPQPGKTFTDSGSTPCSPLDFPPETEIGDGPVGTVTTDVARFSFSSNESGSEFRCSLDGATFSACTSEQEYTGLSEGEHTFQVKAIDPTGNVDTSPATRTWTVAVNNLLANGGFEAALTGWLGFQSTVSLLSGGPEGQSFASVAPTGNVSSYTIFTSPRPIKTSEQSVRYQAAGWFRTGAVGSKVCLNVRERANGTTKTTTSCRKATGGWERFDAVTHSALGGGSIEVFASGVSGPSFDVDGLSLVKLP
jgi:hypothetical protein